MAVLGCMAERLKTDLLEREKWVDVGVFVSTIYEFTQSLIMFVFHEVAGPDSYKDLPRLLAITQSGQRAVNVLLSLDETYADVKPVRMNENSKTAFV